MLRSRLRAGAAAATIPAMKRVRRPLRSSPCSPSPSLASACAEHAPTGRARPPRPPPRRAPRPPSPTPAVDAGIDARARSARRPTTDPNADAPPRSSPGEVNRVEHRPERHLRRQRRSSRSGPARSRWPTRIQATNDSGDGIDRLELNTVAARLGGIEVTEATVDGKRGQGPVDDQTLVVPLGGVLPDGAATTVLIGYRATLRAGLSGSDWMFSRARRHARAVPLDPVGQPARSRSTARTTATRS